MKVDICICTFQRPHIATTLRSIDVANAPIDAALRIIVIDNDDTPSARADVRSAARVMAVPVTYIHAPGRNISIARNAGLEESDADWIAFVDDDERVDSNWLTALIARQCETGADAVFGQSRADYDDQTPDWILRGDFHSQHAALRRGVVETGHTCNALLRWIGTDWRDQRFDESLGQSGGEDTEFFFRLRSLGATYAVAEQSIVREIVPENRLCLSWLLRRRFRIGQSYAVSAKSTVARMGLMSRAALKAAYSLTRALAVWPWKDRRAFWLMRGIMHAGVCAGCLKLRQQSLYGRAPSVGTHP